MFLLVFHSYIAILSLLSYKGGYAELCPYAFVPIVALALCHLCPSAVAQRDPHRRVLKTAFIHTNFLLYLLRYPLIDWTFRLLLISTGGFGFGFFFPQIRRQQSL